MDPVLEIWVDGDRPVVTIRLVGILDRTTRDRLLSVMDELVTEGIESFVMDMGEAEILDASGAAALALLQRLVREAGRTLLWRSRPRSANLGGAAVTAIRSPLVEHAYIQPFAAEVESEVQHGVWGPGSDRGLVWLQATRSLRSAAWGCPRPGRVKRPAFAALDRPSPLAVPPRRVNDGGVTTRNRTAVGPDETFEVYLRLGRHCGT